MKSLLLGGILLLSSAALAEEELNTSYQTESKHSEISIGGEFVTLQSASGSLSGLGPRFGFDFGLSDKWSIAANITFAFEATGKAGSFFYSGLRGVAEYSFIGESMKSVTSVNRADGTAFYSAAPLGNDRFAGFFGLEQLFLNGTTSIYPAAGLAIGGLWEFPFWGHGAQLDIRYSTLTANDNALTMIAVGACFNFDL